MINYHAGNLNVAVGSAEESFLLVRKSELLVDSEALSRHSSQSSYASHLIGAVCATQLLEQTTFILLLKRNAHIWRLQFRVRPVTLSSYLLCGSCFFFRDEARIFHTSWTAS